MTREALWLPTFAHANPVPAASRVGPLLASGALTGRDPVTGEMPADLEAQIANVFADAAMPARQVIVASLDGGALVHADLLAWLG
jgi:2-iminobutanoate/2-iminopropanoate deaminase